MALNQNSRFNRYLSVGGETEYSYTFGIFDAKDLQVQRLRDKEVITLVQGAGNDYIVTDVNNPAGGTIVLNEPAEADDIYAIYGINEYRKNTYSQNTGFRAADANRDMDQSIMIGQQNRRDIDQAIRAPLIDGPVDFTLPPRSERADKVIKFGEDGDLELDDRYPLVTDEEVTEDGLTVVWDGTDGKKVRTAREYIQAPQGTVASRPVPVAGMIRYNTDLLQLEAYDGITWVNVLTSGTGAPIQSTYIVQRPDGVLTDEQALSELDTGIMKSTTGTGVVSIAEPGVDYYGPESVPGNSGDVVYNNDGSLDTTSSISIAADGAVSIKPDAGNVEISPKDDEAEIVLDAHGAVRILSEDNIHLIPKNDLEVAPNRDVNITPDRDVNIAPRNGSVNISSKGEESNITLETTDGDVRIEAKGIGRPVGIKTEEGNINISSYGHLNMLTEGANNNINIATEVGHININPGIGNVNIYRSNPESGVFINDLEYPGADGTPGQVIGTDGDGKLAFVDNTAGSNIFENIAVPGQETITAFGSNDTLNIQSGSNILLETDPDSKTLTMSTTASGVNGTMQFNNNGFLSGALGIITNGSDSMSVSGTINVSGTSYLGNLSVNQNTVSATNLGGDVILSPEGDGHVVMSDLYYPNIDGLSGQVLTTDGFGKISWQQAGGVPGGLNTQIQYNNNGTFGGVVGSTFVGGTLTLSPTHLVMSPSQSVTMSPQQNINLTPDQDINLNPTDGDLKLRGNIWPEDPGTPGQVLTTDGAGTLSWGSGGGGGGGTPGGSNGQFQYNDNGTFAGSSALTLSSNNIAINPVGSLSLKGMTWPSGTGSNGQVLTTDGAGVLSWEDGGGGGGLPPGKDGGGNINPMPNIIPNYEIDLFGDVGSGTNKWAGGVLAPNGKIYAIPYNSTQVLEIDPSNNTTQLFGDVGSGTNNWAGGVLAPNGKIYAIPANSTQVLVIDPSNNTTQLFGNLSGSAKWYSGVLAPNGKIYAIPYNSTQVLVIDPSNNTTQLFGNLSGSAKWYSGVLAPNGKIYAIPRNSTQVLEIDPSNNTTQLFGDVGSGSAKWYSGVLAPNGKIYAIPANSTRVLEIDPSNNTTQLFGDVGSGSAKWYSGVLAPNGKIYAIPYNPTQVLEIDPSNNTTQLFGDVGSGSAKWAGVVLAPNGKIYAIPANSTRVLEIDPLSHYAPSWELSPYVNKF